MNLRICNSSSVVNIVPSAIVVGLLLSSSASAVVLVHESFGEMAGPTEDGDLNGYAGTNGVSEIGLTGTWTLVDNNHRGKVRAATAGDWTPRGPVGGHVVDELGGNLHFLESDNWGVDLGTRPLSSTVDFSSNGTWYMSFFSQAGGDDTLLQIGLSNATNELMWGNGYGNGNTAQGITAYHQALGSGDTTNADGTFMDAGSWDNAFWVAKLEKTNSGTTDDVTVSIQQYNLTTNNVIDSSDPASWTRVVSFGGVSDVFDTLQFKQSGGSGQFPGMDEFRLGESWSDVTGVSTVISPGDVNLDGFVNLTDYGLIRDNFLKSPATYGEGDLTGDNIIDLSDFLLWRGHYNSASGALGSPLSVPEPATWMLAVLGAAAFAYRKTRR